MITLSLSLSLSLSFLGYIILQLDRVVREADRESKVTYHLSNLQTKEYHKILSTLHSTMSFRLQIDDPVTSGGKSGGKSGGENFENSENSEIKFVCEIPSALHRYQRERKNRKNVFNSVRKGSEVKPNPE